MTNKESNSLVLYVNGKLIPERETRGLIDPCMTLLQFLRQSGLTGTKLGCGEGGCGACTVMISRFDPVFGSIRHLSVNACLTPLCALDGCAVTTIEGIGGMKQGLHPVQKRLAALHGSQCGYCTPGIVMAIYTQLRNKPDSTPHELEEAMDGNLCRCTGYRPIIDAVKTLSNNKEDYLHDHLKKTSNTSGGCCGSNGGCGDCPCKLIGGYEEDKSSDDSSCCSNKTKQVVFQSTEKTVSELPSIDQELQATQRTEPIFPPSLLKFHPEHKTFHKDNVTWYQVVTLEELLRLKDDCATKNLNTRMVLGNTEIGIETKFKGLHYPVLINPYHVSELRNIKVNEQQTGICVGASTTVNDLRAFIEHLSAIATTGTTGNKKKYEGLVAIKNMLTWFASNHIRNVASIAGNIVTASPISDLNPMLLATRATLKITNIHTSRILPISEFFLAYRKVDLQPNEVIEEIFIPFTQDNHHDYGLEYVLPFKQARRREDDISIVTSGMSFLLKKQQQSSVSNGIDTDDTVVSSPCSLIIHQCTIAFGGMAPITLLAQRTQNFLQGKVWCMTTIEAAFHVLREEFPLPDNVPGGQAQYRMSLTMSFLLKAYYTITQELLTLQQSDNINYLHDVLLPTISIEEKKTTDNFITQDKPITRGEQVYSIRNGGIHHAYPAHEVDEDTTVDRGVVGKGIIHKNAEAQVSGEAKYTNDMVTSFSSNDHDDGRSLVHAALVMSTRAYARIVRIDTSIAEAKCPGFIRFLSSKDIPLAGTNHIGAVLKDEEVFATEIVKYVGAVIGVVLAVSHEEANKAAKLIHIDYEELQPVIISIDDAIRYQSFYDDHHVLEKGDVMGVMTMITNSVATTTNATTDTTSDSPYTVVEGTVRIGGQEHFYLETNATIAVPTDGNGAMEVISSTQNCSKTQHFCAAVCGIPANQINVKCKRLGGGFGGKETRSVFIAITAALSAYILNRPVSINIERDVDMSITGQRHAFMVKYKAAMNHETKELIYLQADLYSNAGFSLDLSSAVMDRALFHCDNCYHWPNIQVRGHLCKTNQQTHTAFRGFGGPQGLLFVETVLQQLSEKSGVDVDSIRAKNFYRNGDLTHYYQKIEGFNIPTMWEKIQQLAMIEDRKQSVILFNQQNKYKKRGFSLLPTKFGISFTAKFMNQGGSLVHVYQDGTVLIAHGGTEMGQGLHTKVIQIAARAFNIPDTMIFISETSTSTIANASPSAASLSTDLYGMATLHACEQILDRLTSIRERVLVNIDGNTMDSVEQWKSIVRSAYFDRVNLSAHGFYIIPSDRCGYDWSVTAPDQRGQAFNYFTQGVACSEVEIDCLTGDSRVLRADILMDIGQSINPSIDIGQIEGAYIQGYGWCTMEELVYGDSQHPWLRTGQLFTRGPGTYKIPAFNDVPLDMRVYLTDTNNPFAVHSSKAIGEPPFFLGATAFFAIKEAINAARRDNNATEYYPLDSPATSERIRMAMADPIAKISIENKKSTLDNNNSETKTIDFVRFITKGSW